MFYMFQVQVDGLTPVYRKTGPYQVMVCMIFGMSWVPIHRQEEGLGVLNAFAIEKLANNDRLLESAQGLIAWWESERLRNPSLHYSEFLKDKLGKLSGVKFGNQGKILNKTFPILLVLPGVQQQNCNIFLIRYLSQYHNREISQRSLLFRRTAP